jgi:hypothetical protein
MLDIMNQNREIITTELATLVFYMEGGINFEDAHFLSADQRRIFSKTIEKHYSAMNSKKGGNMIAD